MRIYLQSYGCTTGAGLGAGAFFSGLSSGTSAIKEGVSRLPRLDPTTALALSTDWLLQAFSQVAPPIDQRVGLILASTKGAIEDYISLSPAESWESLPDPLTPVLKNFVTKTGLNPVRQLAISNACASSHAAFFLGKRWLESGVCDSVVIAAVDIVGEFVEKGFRTLRAISDSVPRPFCADRDGMALGEGAAVIILSTSPSPFELMDVRLVTEGSALTRPSDRGQGLAQACNEAVNGTALDFIVAHGTGTKANDSAEAAVFQRLFPSVPVTGTKWCIGHTMGASGAMDVIAACEALQRQQLFSIATTAEVDNKLGISLAPRTGATILREALVSSLGFGGMNAALRLRKTTA